MEKLRIQQEQTLGTLDTKLDAMMERRTQAIMDRLDGLLDATIYVAGRTPITVLHMGGRDLWMSFLVVENLDDADQFILGRDFVRNFDVMIDLNNGLIRIRNPDRKYVKKRINRIIADENKVPIFSDRKVKLQPGQL